MPAGHLFAPAQGDPPVYRQMFAQNSAVTLLIDVATRTLVDVNQAACDFYGYSPDEMLGMPLATIKVDSPEQMLADITAAAGGRRRHFEFQHRCKSGEVREVEVYTGPVEVAGRRCLLSIVHDITALRQAERAARESEARFRAIFESCPIGIELANREGRLVATNPALQELLGYSGDELRDIDFARITHPDDLPAEMALDDLLVAGHIPSYQLEKRHIRKNGSEVWTRLTATIARDQSGESVFAVGMVEDITERKKAEDALAYQALHDALTDLPNRTLVQDRLEQALCASERSGLPTALLLLDLDRFKEINDTFGHHHGDLLLQQCAARLRRLLRSCDTVGRLGGDEFALVLPDTDRDGAMNITLRLLQALNQPYFVDGHTLTVDVSLGIALYPEHNTDGTMLLRQADVAMYTAKRAGSGWAFYSPEVDTHSPFRLNLMGELRTAIERDELFLLYQPRVDLLTGRAESVEALVRWQHPVRGLIPPGDFIGMAEQSGLIKPLTLWVLQEALAQARRWQAAGLDLRVAVNLSARSLHDPDIVPAVARLLHDAGADPRRLELEITEGAIMADTERALQTLTRLHEMGVTISIDDFGTGYSSLAYLARLPVDGIKIDRSFVLEMGEGESEAFIVRSVIDLGHNLGKTVVAEGVENRRVLDILRAMGCDEAQGFHVSHPLDAGSVTTWLTAAEPRSA